jgi:acetamidase/formamidase
VLEVQVLEVAHQGWAWSSVLPGLGFLDRRFVGPYLFHWELEAEVTKSLSPAVIPLRPFCGVMGVAPAEHGAFRTRPPGAFGGNLDVRELSAGSTLYLPVMNRGALFSCGDAHAAQGDGEVCINGMECPADVTLRFGLHKGQALSSPMLESAARPGEDGPAWVVVESGADALETARIATSRMVDLLASRWGFEELHGYILCSVAMNLRFSQVVNRPMITVSAAIQKSVLPERRLF